MLPSIVGGHMWPKPERFEENLHICAALSNAWSVVCILRSGEKLFPPGTRSTILDVGAIPKLTVFIGDDEVRDEFSSWVKGRFEKTGESCKILGFNHSELPKADSLLEDVKGLPADQTRLILLTNEYRDPVAVDTDAYRQLVRSANFYRLPWLTVQGLEEVWGGPDAKSIALACLDWTGGQPTLSRIFLRRVAEAGSGADLDNIGYWLVDHRPYFMRDWGFALVKILQDSPALVPQVEALLRGRTFDEPRPDMLPLYLSGWLSQTRPAEDGNDGGVMRWGMPRCMMEWATDFFREHEEIVWKSSDGYESDSDVL